MIEATDAPVSASEFAGAMARLAPFEPRPVIAVGVSGGADSMALALLVDGWVRRRGGRAVALTVDHRLRRGSGAEAREVGRRLRRSGMAHHILTRPGAAPDANIQAAARDARYRLLGAWCRRHGVLHLALGHHLEDQAETVLLRLGRGSGVDGLACMAMVTETRELRLLRPLIQMPRRRLRAVLTAQGVDWIEDPSNFDTGFARVRMRQLAPVLGANGLDARRLAGTAFNMGRARAALEQQTARLLAGSAVMHPAGYCVLDAQLLAGWPREVSLRGLSRVVMCIGGNVYPPRFDRLERLYGRIVDGGLGGGATLAGCRIIPHPGCHGRAVAVTRERRAAGEILALGPGADVLWDNRFRIRLGGGPVSRRAACRVAALGAEGWAQLRREMPHLSASGMPPIIPLNIPMAARITLPALIDRHGIAVVPQLGYRRRGDNFAAEALALAEFQPRRQLMDAIFAVV